MESRNQVGLPMSSDCLKRVGFGQAKQVIAVQTASQKLKSRLKAGAACYTEPQRVRLHRAISWLARAESEDDDPDAQFIFLWIAFNSAYAREISFDESERCRLAQFSAVVLSVDAAKQVHDVLFKQYPGPIRTLLDNKYVFEPFWKALREHDANSGWEAKFAGSKKAALASVVDGDTAKVLSIVFDRLYVLRNQLVHGAATWNSKVNRAQLKDGTAIMLAITPIVITLMLDHPELDFGEIMYPVI